MTTKFTQKLLAFAIAATSLMHTSKLIAQTNVPDAMNFQAIARDASNNIVANTSIEVQMTVHNTSSTGPILSQLRFIRNTDAFGQFSLTMSVDSASGIGTAQTVAFNQINWANGDKYIQIEYKPSIASPYIDLGAIRANSTFYAFHSRTAENITLPATNGQVLKYNGTSNKWEAGADNNTTYTAGNGIAINGSNVVSATDASATNELQTLTQTGNTVTLSNSGGSVNVDPSITNELPTAGAGISVSGNTVSVKSVSDYAVFEERYASGTYAPSGTSASWNQRNINYTQDSSGSSISRSGSIITLSPGKYFIQASAEGYYCGFHKLCIRNGSSSPLLIGTSTFADNAANATAGIQNTASVQGYLTVTGNNLLIKLDHYTSGGGGSSFAGNVVSIPNYPEVYSRIHIQKIQ